LSCSPPLLYKTSLTTSHIRVANIGATDTYFSKIVPIVHLNTSVLLIQIIIANGITSTSSATAQLKNKNVPPAPPHGTFMPEFPRTLVGIAPLCDMNLKVTFTKHDVKAYNQAGNIILEGWHNPEEFSDWSFPLVDKDHNSEDDSLFPFGNDIILPPPTPPPPIASLQFPTPLPPIPTYYD
jgi:hypothetical protein